MVVMQIGRDEYIDRLTEDEVAVNRVLMQLCWPKIVARAMEC